MEEDYKMVVEETDGLGLIKEMLDRFEGEDLHEALQVAQAIWMRRNSLVFEGMFKSPYQVMERVQNTLVELNEATATHRNNPRVPLSGNICWPKPSDGIFKLNWDAAIHSGNKTMGVGAVI